MFYSLRLTVKTEVVFIALYFRMQTISKQCFMVNPIFHNTFWDRIIVWIVL